MVASNTGGGGHWVKGVRVTPNPLTLKVNPLTVTRVRVNPNPLTLRVNPLTYRVNPWG